MFSGNHFIMLSREHGWAFITATALTLLRVVTAEAVGGEGVNGRAVCIRDGDVNCPPDNVYHGNLSLDCSGRDYIIKYGTEVNLQELAIYAECSKPCGGKIGNIYYYDLTDVDLREFNDAYTGTINGSRKINLPTTMDSKYCRVYGCYKFFHFEHGFIMHHKFEPISCFPANLSTATPSSGLTGSTLVFTTANTNLEQSDSGNDTYYESGSGQPLDNGVMNISESSFTTMSSDDPINLRIGLSNSGGNQASKRSVDSAEVIIGVSVSLALFLVIAIIGIITMTAKCAQFHNKHRSHMPHLHYCDKSVDKGDVNDDFEVHKVSDNRLYLIQADSQLSVFNSFYRQKVDTENQVGLENNLKHSFSLTTEYFKVESDSKSVKIRAMEKSDPSILSSTNSYSNLTENTALGMKQGLELQKKFTITGLNEEQILQAQISSPTKLGYVCNNSDSVTNAADIFPTYVEQQLSLQYVQNGTTHKVEAFEIAPHVRPQPVIDSSYVVYVHDEITTKDSLSSAGNHSSAIGMASSPELQLTPRLGCIHNSVCDISPATVPPSEMPIRKVCFASSNMRESVITKGYVSHNKDQSNLKPKFLAQATEVVSPMLQTDVRSGYVHNPTFESTRSLEGNQTINSDYIDGIVLSEELGQSSELCSFPNDNIRTRANLDSSETGKLDIGCTSDIHEEPLSLNQNSIRDRTTQHLLQDKKRVLSQHVTEQTESTYLPNNSDNLNIAYSAHKNLHTDYPLSGWRSVSSVVSDYVPEVKQREIWKHREGNQDYSSQEEDDDEHVLDYDRSSDSFHQKLPLPISSQVEKLEGCNTLEVSESKFDQEYLPDSSHTSAIKLEQINQINGSADLETCTENDSFTESESVTDSDGISDASENCFSPEMDMIHSIREDSETGNGLIQFDFPYQTGRLGSNGDHVYNVVDVSDCQFYFSDTLGNHSKNFSSSLNSIPGYISSGCSVPAAPLSVTIPLHST